MKCLARKIRSPLKYHGGKSYLARKIIDLFTPHGVYVEPFFGGGSVLLNKPPSLVEVAGDTDWNLMSFWRDFQRRHDLLVPWWAELKYSQTTFDACVYSGDGDWEPSTTDFLVRNRMSRGGLGRDFAWSERLRGGQPGDVNAWQTAVAEMPAVAERIRGVRFRLGSAFDLIPEYDRPDALFYCDPPYLHETRSVKKAYAHEMARAGHCRLLDVLKSCEGKVFLSGYRSELYDAALTDWNRHEFSIANHSGQGATKQRRIECVWENHA